MIRVATAALALLLTALLGTATPARGSEPALIYNPLGNFETPGINETSVPRAAGFEIGDWIVTGDSIDQVRSLWKAGFGVQSIDLDGDESGDGGIRRTVEGLTVGGRYRLRFLMSMNGCDPDAAPGDFAELRVLWGDRLVAQPRFTHTAGMDTCSPTAQPWVEHSFFVTASAETMPLEFANAVSPEPTRGAVIDRVELGVGSPAYEPAISWTPESSFSDTNPMPDADGNAGVWRFLHTPEGTTTELDGTLTRHYPDYVRDGMEFENVSPGVDGWFSPGDPTFIYNSNATPVTIGDYQLPGKGFTVAPDETQLAVVEWTSPIAGLVDAELVATDLDPTAGDGVDLQVHHNASGIAKFDLPEGDWDSWRSARMPVQVGDVLSFTVGPNGAPGGDETQLELEITPSPELSLTPDPLAFGDVPLGSSKTRDLQITNDGAFTETVGDITIDGPFPHDETYAPFSIDRSACTTLAPGASCTAQVTFSPTDGASQPTTLRVKVGQDEVATHQLTGDGLVVDLSQSRPNPLRFGIVKTQTTATRTVTLYNTGEALDLDAITLTGTGTSPFEVVDKGTCLDALETFTECTVTVEFSPVTLPEQTAALEFRLAGGHVALSVPLSGEGTESILVNGDFELQQPARNVWAGAGGNGWMTYEAPTAENPGNPLTGWTITLHSVDQKIDYIAPASGNASIELSGLGRGGVKQTVHTPTPNQRYELRFRMAAHSCNDPNAVNYVEAQVIWDDRIMAVPARVIPTGDGTARCRATNGPDDPGDPKWVEKVLHLTASQDISHTLELREGRQLGGSTGTFIDRVTLVPVGPSPRPADWSISRDFKASPDQETPISDQDGNAGAWHLLGDETSMAGDVFDRTGYIHDTTYLEVPGFESWSASAGVPAFGKNTTNATVSPDASPAFDVPPGAIVVHPSGTSPAIVRWVSPIQGVVNVAATVEGLYEGQFTDGVNYELLVNGTSELGTGVLGPRGSAAITDAHVPMWPGETIELRIWPKGDYWNDYTRIDLDITEVDAVKMAAAPSALAFGTVGIGESKTLDLVVTNTGTGAASPVDVTTDSTRGFSVDDGACPASLAAGASCTVKVTYAPAEERTDSGVVRIKVGGVMRRALLATATGSNVSLTPDVEPLDFGSVKSHQTLTKDLTFTNTGTTPVTPTGAAVSPAGAYSVHSEGDCAAEIAVDDTCTLQVEFAPTALGAADAAELQLMSAGTVLRAVALTGSGVPNLRTEPTSLAFGTVSAWHTKTLDLKIVNDGAPVAVADLQKTQNAEYELDPYNCEDTLAKDGFCTAKISFKPTAAGAQPTGIDVLAGNMVAVTVPVTGTGADVSLTAPALAFGDVTVGQTSRKTLTITNAGSAPVDADEIVLSPATGPYSVFSSGTCLNVIAAGATCTATIDYAPTAAQTDSSALKLRLDATELGSFPISGAGVVPGGPELTADPASYGFGTVAVGETASKTFTVSNGGDTAADLTSITVAAPFSITSTADCLAPVAPDDTCEIEVTFAPTTAGGATGTLTFVQGANTLLTVGLSGTGSSGPPPAPVLNPGLPTLKFGAVPLGPASKVKTITFTNGPEEVTPTAVTVPAPFVLEATTCVMLLPADATCTVDVRFDPATAGAAAATATVSASGVTLGSAALQGTGIAANLVENGDFEWAQIPDAAEFVAKLADATLDGWTITHEGIDHIHTHWPAGSGAQSLDMNNNARGGITQTINGLTTGKRYLLTYRLSAHPCTGGMTEAQLRVLWEGDAVAQDVFRPAAGWTHPDPIGWAQESVIVTARDASAELAFLSRKPNESCGPALDDVRLVPTTDTPATTDWSFRDDFGTGADVENPRRDTAGNGGTWQYLQSAQVDVDAGGLLVRDPATYTLDGVETSQTTAETVSWPGTDGLPFFGRNTSTNPFVSEADGIVIAPGAAWVHPAGDRLAVVKWVSPVTDSIDIAVSGADADTPDGDGVDFAVHRGTTLLQAGVLPEGGTGSWTSPAALNVTVGDVLYFTLGPDGGFSGDTTQLDIEITRHAPAAHLTATPPSWGFGSVDVDAGSVTKTITVTNSGDAPADLSEISTSAPFGVSDTTACLAVLAAGATCQVTLSYDPVTTGTHTGTVVFKDGTTTELSVAVSGTGTTVTAPSLSAQPTSLSFGDVSVGHSSAAKTFTVTNNGGATTVSGVTAPGGFGASGCVGALPAGGECIVTVTFDPTTATAHTGDVNVMIGAAPALAVPVSGTGKAVSLTGGPVSFGDTKTGTAPKKTLTVTNAGQAPVSVSSVVVSPAGGPFSASNGTCLTTLAPNATCTLDVTYTATDLGTQVASVQLKKGTTVLGEFATSGTGVRNLSSVASIDFANVSTGHSKSIAVTLTNLGAPVTISAVNTNAAEYTVDNVSCTGTTLAKNQACSVNVLFSPTGPGIVPATLRFLTGGDEVVHTVDLSGNGVNVVIGTSAVDFGSVTVGGASAPKAVTFTNQGSAPVSPTGVIVDPSGVFTISGENPCSTQIPVAGSCTANVVFTPTSAGAASRSLKLMRSSTTLASAALTGTGLAPAGGITSDPASLDFGTRSLGHPLTRPLTITNNGGTAITITSIESSNAAFTIANGTCGGPLTTGATCTAQITYTPALGTQSGTISIKNTNSGTLHTVSASGTGADVSLSATPVAFGDVTVGSALEKTVTFTNNGPGTVDATSLTANATGHWTVPSTGTCLDPIAPGGSCTATVRFEPTTAGAKPTQITLRNGSQVLGAVDVTGTGVISPPSITPMPSALAFGNVTIGNAKTLDLVLKNTGTNQASLGGWTTQTGPYTLTKSAATCPDPIPAGGSCTIAVRFAPTTAAASNHTADFSYVGGTAFAVALTGTGVPAQLTAEPASIDFGSVEAGTLSAARDVTLRNTGTAPLQLSAATTAAPFEKAGDWSACDAPIAPGATCTGKVQFRAPATPGASAGDLQAKLGSTVLATVALTGSSVAAGGPLKILSPAAGQSYKALARATGCGGTAKGDTGMLLARLTSRTPGITLDRTLTAEVVAAKDGDCAGTGTWGVDLGTLADGAYRLEVTQSLAGGDQTRTADFTIKAVVPPTVRTECPIDVGSFFGTLVGTVSPNGLATKYQWLAKFDAAAPDWTVKSPPVDVPASATAKRVRYFVVAPDLGTTQYALTATNSEGTSTTAAGSVKHGSFGAGLLNGDTSAATGGTCKVEGAKPAATTLPATDKKGPLSRSDGSKEMEITLNGKANGAGRPTSYRFEYAFLLGNREVTDRIMSAPEFADDAADHAFSLRETHWAPGMSLKYRAVAINQGGFAAGKWETLTSPCCGSVNTFVLVAKVVIPNSTVTAEVSIPSSIARSASVATAAAAKKVVLGKTVIKNAQPGFAPVKVVPKGKGKALAKKLAKKKKPVMATMKITVTPPAGQGKPVVTTEKLPIGNGAKKKK